MTNSQAVGSRYRDTSYLTGNRSARFKCFDASKISIPMIRLSAPMSRTASSVERLFMTSCLRSSKRMYTRSAFGLYRISIVDLPFPVKDVNGSGDYNKKIRIVEALVCALLFVLCLSAEAQQPPKTYRIGVLSRRGVPIRDVSDPNADAFREGLRDLGYVEGKNIQLEYRYADGKADRFPQLISELIQLKVDLLVSGTIQAIRAAKQATKTIPIVMVITADPVASGLIDSLAHPGSNITGVTRLIRDLNGKRLELLKETIPRVSRIGLLGDTSAQTTVAAFRDYATAARDLNIETQSIEVRNPASTSKRRSKL